MFKDNPYLLFSDRLHGSTVRLPFNQRWEGSGTQRTNTTRFPTTVRPVCGNSPAGENHRLIKALLLARVPVLLQGPL